MPSDFDIHLLFVFYFWVSFFSGHHFLNNTIIYILLGIHTTMFDAIVFWFFYREVGCHTVVWNRRTMTNPLPGQRT